MPTRMNLIFSFGLIGIVSCSNSNVTSSVHRVTHIAWLDISTGGIKLGRIEIGLFGRVVPTTVSNFVLLANRPRGKGYKGSRIHMVAEDFIGGGDWVVGDGRHGQSSFSTREFDDENFKMKHYGAGWVSADGYGEDGQTSLFIITLRPTPDLNGICVVFGKVIKGMNVVRKMALVPVTPERTPKTELVISDCGAALADPPFFTATTDATD